ncbi:MAG: hypothetical protein ACTHJ0_10530 [Flavipsychrobacter sp.]
MNCSAQGKCIKDAAWRNTLDYIGLINKVELCRYDTSKEDYNHSSDYCNPSFFNVYLLNKPQKGTGHELILIEATHNTGTDGYDYYILERTGNSIEKLNYFKGYLDCIKYTTTQYAEIIFSAPTDNGKVKISLVRKGKYYHKGSMLDVAGTDVSSSNKARLLKQYNEDNESHYIEKWIE